MRDSLFTSKISCRGNTNLDCKPVRCRYATVEWATLYSNSHYTGRAGARLQSKHLKLSVASQTASHPGPTCPPVSEARGGEKAWIHPSTCRAEAQAHSARPWQHGQLRSPGLRFGCLLLSLYIKVESRKNTPERERDRWKLVCCLAVRQQSWTLASCVGLPMACCAVLPLTSYATIAAAMCLLNQL